ncbi:hypothetical protein EKO23_08895 [Nocardioides guangzhouensis]|uniref:SnoaL-like domain-containing protein n=1 Tax=Nocardioides guangzhouensis TaxID=2497878 RepID=A0A4Q4ZFE6_9ACTN|nr:hypothetical protein [Nocardioides guangzhouensis]RYP86415.1 hypothetical protein EKO23_08895 [Nocardioides guangzhouensis]
MPRPASRRTSTAAVLLALALTAGACSGDDDGDEASDSPSSDATAQPAPEMKVQSRVMTVAGELSKRKRRVVARDVGAVVDRWFDAAYLGGDYPRKHIGDAWPGFTVGARRLAKRERTLTSNALLVDNIDGVEAVRKVVRVDVFSPKRRPAGATARFRLVYDTTGDIARRVDVRGRLLLTRTQGRWRVFGFDMVRSTRPRKGVEAS